MYGSNNDFHTSNKGDDVITKHPELAPLFKNIYEATQHPKVQTELMARFKKHDNTESGNCHKDDFVNSIFESIQSIKPSDLMQLVSSFTAEYDQYVNYNDFLALVERHGGNYGGNEFKSQQMSAEKNF